jgi:hypothetical protein
LQRCSTPRIKIEIDLLMREIVLQFPTNSKSQQIRKGTFAIHSEGSAPIANCPIARQHRKMLRDILAQTGLKLQS